MPTTKPRERLALSDAANAAINARAEPIAGGLGRSASADRIITRYEELMTAERDSLCGRFDTAELALLLDVLGSTPHDSVSIRYMIFSLSDALPEYAPLHGVTDAGKLLRTVDAMSLLGRYALVDALERFTSATARGEEKELNQLFRAEPCSN